MQPDLLILPLSPHHNHQKFSAGTAEFQPLKAFIQKEALVFKLGFMAQTYVAVDDNERRDKTADVATYPYKIIGYITLTCSEVAIEDYVLAGCERAGRYGSFPAIKIARLAVDAKCRAAGIGTSLYEHALLLAKETIMPTVGCRFLITDAKRKAIPFYQKKQMALLETSSNLQDNEHPIMFVDLYHLQNTVVH